MIMERLIITYIMCFRYITVWLPNSLCVLQVTEIFIVVALTLVEVFFSVLVVLGATLLTCFTSISLFSSFAFLGI